MVCWGLTKLLGGRVGLVAGVAILRDVTFAPHQTAVVLLVVACTGIAN